MNGKRGKGNGEVVETSGVKSKKVYVLLLVLCYNTILY
jgi:hypothetical protein